MRTTALTADYSDIALGQPAVDGHAGLRARIMERLRFWAGTWYLDDTAGVPYLGDIINRIGGTTVTPIITARILEITGVKSVTNVVSTYDPETRILAYEADVAGDDDILLTISQELQV